MPYDNILFEKDGLIATIWLNTPQNFNALAVENLKEVCHALDMCEKDETIRVIIFAGKGKIFSSGGNVKEFLESIKNGQAPQKIADISEVLHQCAEKIMTLEKPVIGKIQGGAYGAGLNLILTCDLVYAEENAILDEAFVNVGLSIDGSGSYTIPRLVGTKKAKELFWLGKITAKEAEQWGLINRALPPTEFDQYVANIAKKIADLPPLNIKNTKKLLNLTFLSTIAQQLETERQIQIQVAGSEDFAEGVTAFFEKRKPHFKGK